MNGKKQEPPDVLSKAKLLHYAIEPQTFEVMFLHMTASLFSKILQQGPLGSSRAPGPVG